tara:strand:+ start:274 stop:687 length:414 start_codon:yes stop_codon:yes gene_type:complete
MPFDLKDAVAKWEALEKTDKGVPSQAFIDASLAITNIFDELSGMGMVKSDIGGNAGKIQKNVTDASKTLEEMVDAEIAAAGGDVKKATKEGSTGLALLWLKRCGPHPTRANHQHGHGRAWPRDPPTDRPPRLAVRSR